LRLTSETERQLALAAPGLQGAARERVLEELRLALAGPAVERALLGAIRCRLLVPLLPAWEAFDRGAELARRAGRLGAIACRRDGLGAGAVDVVSAVLAAPAAGFPARWDIGAGAGALVRAGYPERRARRVNQAVELSVRLARVLDADVREARGLAAEAGPLLPMSLAWAVAGRDEGGTSVAAAVSLLRWWRRFAARPPLLSGAEIARLLDLAEGPARAAAIRRLLQAHAQGEVRTAAQARDYLTR
jgi:tRNA nucleotidyltransferase/poly(A) polymerase